MLSKNILRKEAISKRKDLSIGFVESSSELIVKKLVNFYEHKKVDIVFSFFAMRGEVDLSGLFRDKKVDLAFPKIIGDQLEFYRVESSQQLQKQSFGIWEPINGLQRVFPKADSLILVPALLLAKDGSRLGLGKGFYDRFLTNYPEVLSIGVVFDQFIVDRLPVDSWDVRLGGICSEARLEILGQID